MTERVRNFVFTLNNFSKDEESKIQAFPCKYMVYGREKGKEGTPHLQGYVELSNGMSFSALKKKFSDRAHLEERKGTPKQAAEYCKKDGDIFEKGKISNPGKRSDLQLVKEAVLEKKEIRMQALIPMCNSYQAAKFAETLIKYSPIKRDWLPKVIWICGPTGSGKTRIATELCGFLGDSTWMSGRDLKFWEGYDGDECVVLDDFRGDFCSYHELLRILDRYPYRVNTKGSSRELLAKYIFITCPYMPNDVYHTVEDKKQLFRRIEFVLNTNDNIGISFDLSNKQCILKEDLSNVFEDPSKVYVVDLTRRRKY